MTGLTNDLAQASRANTTLVGDLARVLVAVYGRVSSPPQARGDRQSMMLQITEWLEEAQRRGWTVVGVWSEVGSASPGWQELPVLREVVTRQLAAIDADILAAWDVLRLTRAVVADFMSLWEQVARQRAVGGIVTLDDPLLADAAERRVVCDRWNTGCEGAAWHGAADGCCHRRDETPVACS